MPSLTRDQTQDLPFASCALYQLRYPYPLVKILTLPISISSSNSLIDETIAELYERGFGSHRISLAIQELFGESVTETHIRTKIFRYTSGRAAPRNYSR